MDLILFDNFLWTQWISYSLSIGVFGIFCFIKDALPDWLKRIYKYGKVADSHRKSSLGSKLELPKSWFFHFYVFATVFYSFILYSIIRVYIFNQELPELTKFLLDNEAGINRQGRVPSESVLFAAILILIHVIRRLLECLFVSVYSKGRMNIFHYVIAMLYYFNVGLSVIAEGNGLTNKVSFISSSINWINFFSLRHMIGFSLFIYASYLHNNSHHILANLRKNKEGKVITLSHVMPTGGLFEYVSCPHFFAEILIYISIAIIQCGLSITWWLLIIFVVTNQLINGVMHHQWYKDTFKDYPKNRKAVIPFLI